LVLARQALYCWSHASFLFVCLHFWDRVSHYAAQAYFPSAGITGVYHHAQFRKLLYCSLFWELIYPKGARPHCFSE
jgi:hypothetical protein